MKKRFAAVLAVLCLLLTACGQSSGEKTEEEPVQGAGQETGQDMSAPADNAPEEEKISWTVEERTVPDADAAMADVVPEGGSVNPDFNQWFFRNGTVYRVSTVQDEEKVVLGCCIQKLDAPYAEWISDYVGSEDWVQGENCYVGQMSVGDSGLGIMLRGEQGTYIGEWTEEGPAVAGDRSDVLEKYLEQMPFCSWFKGADGSLFLYDMNEAVHMDDHYEVMGDLGREDGIYVVGVAENPYDGKDYLVCPTEFQYDEAFSLMEFKGFRLLSSDGKQELLCSPESLDVNASDKIAFCSETEGYLYDSTRIFQFSLEDGEIELLYDFADDLSYYDQLNAIAGGSAEADGSHVLLVTCKDGSYRIWQVSKAESQTEDGTEDEAADTQKQVLEWAVLNADSFMQQAVVAFNQQSKEYEVVFRRPDPGESTQDFSTRIQAELSAGEGPDLLLDSVLPDTELGGRSRFLEDLTDLFAEYEDEILPSAWKLGVSDGYRYGMPFGCTVMTLVTDERRVGNADHWTMEEAMESMEQSDAKYFIAGADEALLFYYMGLQSETNAQLVDWEEGVSHLDSETAVKLLEFAAKYADHECAPGDESLEAAEGKALTSIFYLMSPEMMKLPAAMFENHEAYIGFPTEHEESGHMIVGEVIGVNRFSPRLEGAVEFVRFLLSEEMQSNFADYVLRNSVLEYPVKKSAMEKVYSYLREDRGDSGLSSISGIAVEAGPLSEESIEKMKAMIETAEPVGHRAGQLLDIINEELAGFSASGKSAQEVLKVINNRVQLYLDESMQ